MSGLQALYVDGPAGCEVRLDDGVALSIGVPGRARRLVPLRRLSRVLSGTDAHWDGDALLACLRAGVPVVFHDARGEPVGWCFGPRRSETTLAQLLREGLSRPEWDSHFGDWKAACERREMLAAAAELGVHWAGTDAAAMRVQLCNRHRAETGAGARKWLRALRSAAAGLVGQQLHDAVGDAELLAYARAGLNLPWVFTTLMEWRLHRILHATPAWSLAEEAPVLFAARAVERHGATLHGTIGALTGDLEHTLRGWLW